MASAIDGRRIVVGSGHLVEDDEGIQVAAHREVIDRLHREGKTLRYIGFGGELLDVLALRDGLRANSAATIRGLRRLGVKRVLMLTGDHPERARTMAEAPGLDDFHAGLLPQDQADVLQRLAAEGARIAFAGLPRDGRTSAAVVHGART